MLGRGVLMQIPRNGHPGSQPAGRCPLGGQRTERVEPGVRPEAVRSARGPVLLGRRVCLQASGSGRARTNRSCPLRQIGNVDDAG